MKPQSIFHQSGLIAFILLMFIVSACKKDNKADVESEYRIIAWNYLSESSKVTVITKVEDAPIEYLVYKEQQAVSVMFNTTQDPMLGPIVVYISVADKSVLGVALRF